MYTHTIVRQSCSAERFTNPGVLWKSTVPSEAETCLRAWLTDQALANADDEHKNCGGQPRLGGWLLASLARDSRQAAPRKTQSNRDFSREPEDLREYSRVLLRPGCHSPHFPSCSTPEVAGRQDKDPA